MSDGRRVSPRDGRRRLLDRAGKTLVIAVAILWLVPVYLLVVNAMTATSDYEGTPRWIPGDLGFVDNFMQAWRGGDFGVTTGNSLLYATACSGAAVVVATLAAYAIVALRPRRPALWFWLIYSGALLPLQVFARPLFLGASQTNLYDTRLGLSIVYIAICIPFALFVVRNVLITLPTEIAEAARIDGAGWLRMLLHVHLPLARPAMAAAFAFQFIFIWNELFFGITLSISPQVQPVMASLAGLQGDYSQVGQPGLLAAALVLSLPTIALFFGFQRFFVSGLKTNL